MNISSPTPTQAEEPPTRIVASTAVDAIGAERNGLQDVSDVELEQHIQDCGHRMELAMARGDKAEAREWLILQRQAIEARSEAQKARMQQVIDEGCDYFSTEGERAHRMLVARGLVHA